MITLYPFQQTAADQIAQRVTEFILEPVFRGRGSTQRRVPFVQFLSSITASGKTVVLADAVEQIAVGCAVRPVVLWVSKLTVVVEQSFANLDAGGSYHDLIDDFEVRALAELSLDELRNIDAPFLYFATTGKFNQRDKEGRRIFRSSVDAAAKSIWESLALRPDAAGLRRPLVVVYDEAHNLSPQQTRLLVDDLDPDAFILSTATTRIPAEFRDEVVEPLKTIGEVEDILLNTVIVPSVVAASGLVKNHVDLIGRLSQMEDVVSEMVAELHEAEIDAEAAGLSGPPKAVYVCRTNIIDGDDRQTDDPKQPFLSRQAPPIMIWRHLVEGLGIDPATIAVYCNLKVDKAHPLPEEFILFNGRDDDYDAFVKGDYQHIIFNQTLQEGWDDPLVYFAYIDKTLGSTIAAEQIVGRLLRQPGRQRYRSLRLNTAQVHVRVQANSVFDEVVERTQAKLRDDQMPVVVRVTTPSKKHRDVLAPKGKWIVPEVATHTEDAIEEMEEIIGQVPTFGPEDLNTSGTGRRARVQRVVGGNDQAEFIWEEVGTSARVTARWMFSRELRRFHRDAAAAITLDDPKWDVRIGVGSPASAVLMQFAEKVGQTFIRNSYIEVAEIDDDDYIVGDALVRDESFDRFDNAIHDGYDGLNPTLERPFARELDRTGLTWCRNPSQSGYGIPTIQQGGNDTFYPDFLVWGKEGDVFAIDTKGSHLHADAKHKHVRIRQSPGRPEVNVCFVLQGTLDANGIQISPSGYTVLRFGKDGTERYIQAANLKKAVELVTK